MLQATTKRLFYNKWPIKVECRLQGASKLKRLGIMQTIDWCDGKIDDDRSELWSVPRRPIDKVDLKKFAFKVAEILENKEVKIRTEGNHYNIFCADTQLLGIIQKELYPWIQQVTSPETTEQYDFLMENGHKKVICNQFPHDKFRYRVFLRESAKQDARSNFYNWLTRYQDKVKITGNTARWMQCKLMYAQDPYFYVEDDKMLSMVLLYLGNNCKKIQEFILKSSINT